MHVQVKSLTREIQHSFGRYIAILAIIALGVGIFSGLKNCRPAMAETVESYFETQNFYDYRMVSSIGFSKDAAEAFTALDAVTAAEGASYEDALIPVEENESVFRIHSITTSVNKLNLLAGRMPQTDTECVVDADFFQEDQIGQTLRLSDTNTQETFDAFETSSFTIVGIVTSPLYIRNNRGTTSLGNGKIAGFLFVPASCFTATYDKELYLSIENDDPVFSDAYQDAIDDGKSEITTLSQQQADRRYMRLLSDAQQEVDDATAKLDAANKSLQQEKATAIQQAEAQLQAMGESSDPDGAYRTQMMAEIDDAFAESEKEIADQYKTLEQAQADVDAMQTPSVYLFTRNDNAGYSGFQQDSAIIENIAIVFPVFFFLVAALVCVTTMTRMLEEQRTQIGVWKSMGYGKMQISWKYLLYAGSAGLIGSIAGFFAGTAFLPMIFWCSYKQIYHFADQLLYVLNGKMLLLSIVLAMLCTAVAALICCWKELLAVPAVILRPKAPKNGKRILLERVSFFWHRIGFLHKVTLRNVMRYKQRFFLMILGISGCTALLLTGFGIQDSIQNVMTYQYHEISFYDGEITFSSPLSEEAQNTFSTQHEDVTESVRFLSVCNVDISAGNATKAAQLTMVEQGDLTDFFDLHTTSGTAIAYPQDNEIILCTGIAEKLSVSVGDTVTLMDDAWHQISLHVSGVFDNYVNNYAFVTENTMTQFYGSAPINGAYIKCKADIDVHEAAANLLNDTTIGYLSLNADMQSTIEDTFSSLNLVILLVIFCAGALAFIVLFNLVNINIGERIREIATLKVLGFTSRESSAYIFREVNLLTVIGALLGLPLGKLLHTFVMQQINPDVLHFENRITWQSYVYSVALTLLFSILVRFAMQRKLKKIKMAESLKSVE